MKTLYVESSVLSCCCCSAESKGQISCHQDHLNEGLGNELIRRVQTLERGVLEEEVSKSMQKGG